MSTALLTWGIIFAVAVIAELATLQLVTIWFAAGALGAFIAAALGASPLVQGILFTAISVVLLAVTRPMLQKLRVKNVIPTNADAEVGKLGILTEPIDPVKDTGRVRIGGVNWRARTEDGSPLQKDTPVRITRIEGTTAFVRPDTP
ncbi:MAG: NfeD family protein [Oscillospiraceae bacterium]|nr:NfeD family protein [Oscillospiraceae bacterium]